MSADRLDDETLLQPTLRGIESARREALTWLGLREENLAPRSLNGSGGTVIFRLRLDEKSGGFERRDARQRGQ